MSSIHLFVHAQSSDFSEEEETFFLNNTRPMTPLVLNPIHHTSRWEDFEPRVDMEVERPPRLPTPEERMRQHADAIAIAVVPINITGLEQNSHDMRYAIQNKTGEHFFLCFCSICVSGESFDRQASFRRVASNNDSLSQRYCNLSRRKTITGIPTTCPEKTSTDLILF